MRQSNELRDSNPRHVQISESVNHLAHFRLADPEPGLMLGAFLGDYVKGRLKGDFPTEVERGIRLHRAIDAFTDRHETVRRSSLRFDPRFRRYGPIMLDVIFDHFLACRWRDFHSHSLTEFNEQVFSTLSVFESLMPETSLNHFRRMRDSSVLLAYTQSGFIRRSMESIASRFTRQNPLAEAYEQFLAHQQPLEEDFEVFFPQLIEYVRQWKCRANFS